MKKLILLFMMSLTTFTFSQTCDLVVFSEDGYNFFLIVNGEQVNDQAKSNVKKTDISSSVASVKIKFADQTMMDISKPNLMLGPDQEITYVIKKNKKGEIVLAWKTQGPKSNNNVTATTTTTSGSSGTTGTTTTTSGVVVKETTTTTTTTGGTSDNVSIGIGGVGVSVTVNDGYGYGSGSTTTTTTTTTTEVVKETDPCINGMNSTEFSNAKKSIQSSNFDDTKVSTIKSIVNGKCFTSAQLKEMINLLTFEENKLSVAKYAYSYVKDPGNYFVVGDALEYDLDRDELNNYINNNRR